MTQDLFNASDKEKMLEPTGNFLKLDNFAGPGLVVLLAAPVERMQADEGFGDKEGMTNVYQMKTKDGKIMELDSSSRKLAKALIEAHIQVGDWARIRAEKNESGYWEFEVKKIEVEGETKVDTVTALGTKEENPFE